MSSSTGPKSGTSNDFGLLDQTSLSETVNGGGAVGDGVMPVIGTQAPAAIVTRISMDRSVNGGGVQIGASPVIMQAMTMAAVFDDVWIWQKKSGASKERSGDYFWKVHLQNVHISDLTWSADSDNLTETLSLTYQKIDVEYYAQKSTGELEKKAIKGQYPEPGAKLSVVKSKADGVDAGDIEQKLLKKLKQLNPSLRIS